MDVPLAAFSSGDEGVAFCISGSGFVAKRASASSGDGPIVNNSSGVTNFVRLLALDGVSLASVVSGVPEGEHEVLADHLAQLLCTACETEPMGAARILTALLLMEFDRATRRCNDVHTFMRGNGVVPKVFENFFAKVTGAGGGLEHQLLGCCAVLCDPESTRPNTQMAPKVHDTVSKETEAPAQNEVSKSEINSDGAEVSAALLLREGLDYFSNHTVLDLESGGDTSPYREEYARAILAMSHRILDVVLASALQWPWSLRRCLRFLVEMVGTRCQGETPPVHAEAPIPLEQNMMATIVVLRAVVPALLRTLPRLLPEEMCFDRQYVLVQRRCTLLAKVTQKATHGLLFNGSHEKRISALNSGLPALTQRWVDGFALICTDVEQPSPRQDSDALSREAEAALRLCEFLDQQLPRVMHAAMRCKPIMESVHWGRVLRLIAYGERRLGRIGHFATSPLSYGILCPNNSNININTNTSLIITSGAVEPAAPLQRPRHMLGQLSRLGHSRSSSDAPDVDSRTTLQLEGIFDELVAYALGVTIDPEITGLHANFCSVLGVSSDGAVVITLYWDLLCLYLDSYYAKERDELPRRCPRFYRHRRHSEHRDGDALAFLFLLVDVAVSTKGGEGFRLVVIAGNSSACFSWLGDVLRLLPARHAVRCVRVLLLTTAEFRMPHRGWCDPFEVKVLQRLGDLVAALRDMRLCMPLGCDEYRALLEEEEEQAVGERLTDAFFPSVAETVDDGIYVWAPPVLHMSLKAREVGLWPVALMRDVFELIRTAFRPVCVPAAVSSSSEDRALERLTCSIPVGVTSNFRMSAVEFFFNFEGDLLLHLEMEPGWLRDAARTTGGTSPSSKQQKNHGNYHHEKHQSRFRCTWRSVAHMQKSDLEAHESSLLRLLFLSTQCLYTAGGCLKSCSSADGAVGGGQGLPSVVPSLRHTTLNSLWRLLLYNLWKTLSLVQQVSPSECPVTRMVTSVRAYLERVGCQVLPSKDINLLGGESMLLDVAAAALASTPVAECELIQLLVAICSFVRSADFEELGPDAKGQSDDISEHEEAMTDGVIRILFQKGVLDDAEIFVARLIASRGDMLLKTAQVPSWDRGLWMPHIGFIHLH